MDARLFDPQACPRLVVKIGSSLLVTPVGEIRRTWLAGLLAELVARRKAGQQVLIVSSGAVALGARRLRLPKGGRANLEDAQAAAAVGQIELAQTYADLLGQHGVQAAQLLLTLDDLEDRRRYLNVTATVGRLLEADAMPVINENDSVATAEIRFGDNDRLAARVGQAVEAAGVILFSDIDGFYTADPRHDPSARRIAVVAAITPEIEALAGGIGASGMGSGGMAAKLKAARIATSGGCHLAITTGHVPQPLAHFCAGETGTIFAAAGTPLAARKRWLAGRITVAGTLSVDDGAARALRDGRSLLAAGITACAGAFARGDVLDVLAGDGTPIARGLASYDADEVRRILGCRNADIAALLGYAPRAAVIHRDSLVLL